jgi:hypothetical protein
VYNLVVKRILLAEIFFIGISVAVLHKIALSLFLYWNVWWFDIMMHFLGGALISLITLFFIYDSKFFNFKIKNKAIIFCAAVGMTLIIGLGWELWEIYVGFIDIYVDGPDSFLDLIMDVAGAVAVYLYSKEKICKMEN